MKDHSQRCKKIREYYGYTTKQMSQLMGFGVNQWRNYEEGSPPNKSNSLLIRLVEDPEIFLKILRLNQEAEASQK